MSVISRRRHASDTQHPSEEPSAISSRPPIDAAISSRISILRYLLVCGIVVVHVEPKVPLGAAVSDVGEFVRAFLQNGLFRTAVPVLTCISAYLLFHADADRTPGRLIRRKSATLLVPFLIWNGIALLFKSMSEGAGRLAPDHWSHRFPEDLDVVMQYAFAQGGPPANAPLFFLHDLFLLMLIAPFVGVALRRAPWVGLSIVIVLDTSFDLPLLFRDSMLLNFYCGGMAAILAWRLDAFDRYAPWLAAFLIAGCAWIVVGRTQHLEPYRWVAPFFVWPVGAWFVRSRFEPLLIRLAPYSFAIFVSHHFANTPVGLLRDRLEGRVSDTVMWCIALPIMLGLAHLTGPALSRLAPRAAAVALGGRLPRRAPSTVRGRECRRSLPESGGPAQTVLTTRATADTSCSGRRRSP